MYLLGLQVRQNVDTPEHVLQVIEHSNNINFNDYISKLEYHHQNSLMNINIDCYYIFLDYLMDNLDNKFKYSNIHYMYSYINHICHFQDRYN